MSDWPEADVEFVKDTNIKDSIRTDSFSGRYYQAVNILGVVLV